MQLTVSMVRTLKGCPLAVLMVLLLEQKPVGAGYIERHSGYSDKSVLAALELLADYGLVSRNDRYHWQITAGAAQLPLMPEALPAPETEPAEPTDESGTRNNSESEILRVDCSSSSRSINSIQVVNPPLLERAEPEKLRVAVLAELDAAGIREPKRGKIAAIPGITAELVRYWVEHSENIGQAIYRLEHGWRIPAKARERARLSVPTAEPAEEPAEVDLPVEAERAWQAAVNAVGAGISRADFEAWLLPTRLVGWSQGQFQVATGNRFGRQWICEHALSGLRDALGAEVEILVGGV